MLADLIDGGGISRGPHAFLVDLRDRATGALASGVRVADMGRKTTGNDLDNAAIRFDRFRVPRGALLNGYADVDGGGAYVLKERNIAPFAMIGQRLYSGRVAVAQAALEYRRQLFDVTRECASRSPPPSPFLLARILKI